MRYLINIQSTPLNVCLVEVQIAVTMCQNNYGHTVLYLYVTRIGKKFFLLFVSKFSNNKEEHQKSIFTQCDKHGFRLKDNVQFHLYISTSPCGDARIFSPHEAGVEGETESSVNQTVQFFTQDLAGRG